MKLLGLDLETSSDLPGYGLQPCRLVQGKARIKAVSVASNGHAAGTLWPSVEYLRNSLSLAISLNMYVVGWNVSFDAAWLIAAGLETEVFGCKWLDAMLLWKHWISRPEDEDTPQSQRKSYSLKKAMEEFFPEEVGFKGFEDFDAMDEDSLRLLLERNKGDALFSVKFAELFWRQLTPVQQRAAIIESYCIPMVAWTKVYGLKSSREAAEALSQSLDEKARHIQKQLEESSPEVKDVNLGSPKQLQTLLFEKWSLPVKGQSKKTLAPSTDKYALFYLAELDPRAKMLKELRESKNNRTKYPEAVISSLVYNEDGFVRPQAKIFGTYTGRMTYASRDKSSTIIEKVTKKETKRVPKKIEVPTGVALHQWKRGKEYRRLILPPPGYGLAEFDFAGQEFRWMAVASEDETMLGLCAPGEDPHGFMGSQISECNYRELVRRVKAGDEAAANSRKAGKFCNLSYQYRVGSAKATIKAQVEFEMAVDELFIKQTQAIYKQSYPGVPAYWLNQIRKCSQLRYAETYAGRRVQLDGDWLGRGRWGLESTSINYPIQGTGADQKYLALAVARGILPEYSGYFYFELHDGLFFIFPLDKIEKAAARFKDVLSNLPYEKAWGVKLPIKFPVDAKIGSSWGDLKEI